MQRNHEDCVHKKKRHNDPERWRFRTNEFEFVSPTRHDPDQIVCQTHRPGREPNTTLGSEQSMPD
jgi:hypothetical protein